MSAIILESSDGVQFKIDAEIAKFSGTIASILEYCGQNDEKDSVVPLPNVSGDVLRHILEWAKHHKNDLTPTIDYDANNEPRIGDIPEWDADFLGKFDQGTLFELVSAAHYLDANGLMAVIGKTIVNMSKGKTTEEMRTIFNIKNDFVSAEMDEDSDDE